MSSNTWHFDERYASGISLEWDAFTITMNLRAARPGGGLDQPILLQFLPAVRERFDTPLRATILKALRDSEVVQRYHHAKDELAEAKRQADILGARAAKIEAEKSAAVLAREKGLPPRLVAWDKALEQIRLERESKTAEIRAVESILPGLKAAAEKEFREAVERAMRPVREAILRDRAEALADFGRKHAEELDHLVQLDLTAKETHNGGYLQIVTAGLLDESADGGDGQVEASGAGVREEALQPA